MPAFQAINLEAEENVDDQIDTSKELHVEEALKRFQKALRLHAQGPRARDAAREAYQDLFASEIFSYREALTDYERAEKHADDRPEASIVESFAATIDIDSVTGDAAAASLSQALYLAYKNYGQLHVDTLKDQSLVDPEWRNIRMRYASQGKPVVDNWMAALDQDPSDPELWRKMARFAGALNSGRVKRFCLEAAIELDDDPTVMEVEPPSLAEGLAGEQLKEYLQTLDDSTALSHPVMSPWMKRKMPAFIERFLDPIPFLPDPSASLTPPLSHDETVTDGQSAEDITPTEPISSWDGLGLELIKCVHDTDRALRACRQVLETAQQTQDVESGSAGKGKAEKDTEMAESERVASEVKSDIKSKPSSPSAKDQQAADSNSPKASDQSQKDREASRKRSQSVAGLHEGAEEENGVEKRSKRVRRRTEAAKDVEEAADPSALIATQIQPFQDADSVLFGMTKTLMEKLGVDDRDTLDCLQEVVDSCTTEDRTSKITRLAAQDLRSVMTAFNEDTAMALLNKKEQVTLGLSSFLEHAKSGSQDRPKMPPFDASQGLKQFAESVSRCSSWMTNDDVCFEWVRAISESYATETWSDVMKVTVVQMINRNDAMLFERISGTLQHLSDSAEEMDRLETMIPMLFELHIDIYERITNPSSVVDYATRTETKHRLGRWLDVASNYVHAMGRPDNDPLCVRFLWASVLASSLSDSPVREHIQRLWTSMRDFLASEGVEQINLPNNVVMPVISSVAAEREISTLTTMDFFLGLFQDEMEDPVQVIDTLEPVLNPSSVMSSTTDELETAGRPVSECATQGMRDLWKFLASSGTELRLFLWSRLGDAYAAINYQTKRLSCILKSIEMIMADLEGETYAATAEGPRRLLLMRTMKSLDELLVQALSMALNDGGAFDIVDEEHARSSAGALARLSCLLHVASLCEDEGRMGINGSSSGSSNNNSNSSNSSTQTSLVNKLREMQVRTWSMQYTLLRAGQLAEDELAGFLAAVHQAVGIRKFCKSSNKILLKMMRMELLKWSHDDESHLSQVLFDLHGLKLGVGAVSDHGCPADNLERRQAIQLVERVTTMARRMAMKDLLKSELKTTIEHLQQAIGQTKSTPQMIYNLRNFTEYLKKPIHPQRLLWALRGNVAVDAVGVNIQEATLAAHGWFFLLGMIALTKFKGVDLNRRQTPGATDDLRIGATFLRLQLQFTADNWQAWFRLAECFDYELDEAVLWTADKMNKDRVELVRFQRNAIHCYTLALSHSVASGADDDALHDLYHKFAMRLYSSSREPFAMEPFRHLDHERFFIEDMGAGTYKRTVHQMMAPYKVLKLAARLFRMAMTRRPDDWMNRYMLAKCYWKMYRTPAEERDRTLVTPKILLWALTQAIEVATRARKTRNSEPILEPHYKMVSILHKLVGIGDLTADEAAATLAQQPFGVTRNEDEGWNEYVIRNLTRLRDKDKSNWQHRIVMRHARVLFDDLGQTKAAFAILKDSMFTKTMVMNVWKCDAERPGRHHVFTEQYVRFVTRLLVLTADRVNLDLLLRRLRKKGADFYHFTDLWQSTCAAYIELLRSAYGIRPASEDGLKAVPPDDFEAISDRVSEWAAAEGQPQAAPELGCMRDAVELKKLNANLMKVAPVDDLINDCYIAIFLDVAGKMPPKTNNAEQPPRPPASLSSILNPANGSEAAATEADKSETAPKGSGGGRKAIRRLDVLRKAEQAVVRSFEAPTKPARDTKTGSGRVSSAASKRGSQTPAVAMSDAGSRISAGDDEEAEEEVEVEVEEDEEDEDEEEVDEEEAADNDGEDGPGGSIQFRPDDGDEEMKDADARPHHKNDTDVGGSLHDSADDESDLSDVPEGYDEDVPPGLLLANLERAPGQSAEASGAEADSESEGEETVEEEVDDEGEELEEGEEGDEDDEGDEGEEGEEAEVDDEDEVEVDDEAIEVDMDEEAIEVHLTAEETESEEGDSEAEEDGEEEEDGPLHSTSHSQMADQPAASESAFETADDDVAMTDAYAARGDV
ncbi:hypothetical protein CDD80_3941 [Ophiocordyceps camponoti-rufipedis]|uniref:Histone transcription regulator 3 homolog n=1 Tax=Ophiocordyceps camponoti-rufipedis TaxID=2004952 RepID=A0A2C5Z206_9HYPO|nr:hypothetical protein CDD80_3941 [Ophiocordyceps camponoti-rufipedis]